MQPLAPLMFLLNGRSWLDRQAIARCPFVGPCSIIRCSPAYLILIVLCHSGLCVTVTGPLLMLDFGWHSADAHASKSCYLSQPCIPMKAELVFMANCSSTAGLFFGTCFSLDYEPGCSFSGSYGNLCEALQLVTRRIVSLLGGRVVSSLR